MKFFNPTDEFVDKLIDVIGDRIAIEIGFGEGDLLYALNNRKMPVFGIDPFVDVSMLPS